LDVLIEQHAQVKKLSIRFVIIKTLHPKEDESNNSNQVVMDQFRDEIAEMLSSPFD